MIIIVWLLSLVGIPAPPPEVLLALSGLVAGAGSLLGGYLKREFNINVPADSPAPAPSPAPSQGPVP
jgi:hypothetical protein